MGLEMERQGQKFSHLEDVNKCHCVPIETYLLSRGIFHHLSGPSGMVSGRIKVPVASLWLFFLTYQFKSMFWRFWFHAPKSGRVEAGGLTSLVSAVVAA